MCIQDADWLECCQVWKKPHVKSPGKAPLEVCDEPNYPACLQYRLKRKDFQKCQIHAPKILPVAVSTSDLAGAPDVGVAESSRLESHDPPQSDPQGSSGEPSDPTTAHRPNIDHATLQQPQVLDQHETSSQAADTPRSRARAWMAQKQQFKADCRAQCPDLNEDQVEETWARARGQTWAEWWGDVSSDDQSTSNTKD